MINLSSFFSKHSSTFKIKNWRTFGDLLHSNQLTTAAVKSSESLSLYRKKRVVVITTAKRSFFRWKLHIISLFSIEEEKPTLFSLSYLVSFNVDPKLIFFYSIHWWTVNLEFPLFPLPDQTSYSPPCSWLVIDRTVALHPKAAVPLKIRLFSLCIQLFLDKISAGIVCIEKG